MKLVEAQVSLFRNILDSTPVAIEPDITCLVGKNESGKTAFLHALNRLNPDPARPSAVFSIPAHYPAWREKKDRQSGKKLEDVRPIRAVFKLEEADRVEVRQRFGTKVLKSDVLGLERAYGGALYYTIDTDESAAVQYVVGQTKLLKGEIQKQAKSKQNFAELKAFATELKGRTDKPEEAAAGAELETKVSTLIPKEDFDGTIWSLLKPRLPVFFYFGEYSKLPYSIKIREILQTQPSDLPEDQATARSLLMLAGAEQEYILNADYERRKRELENVANAITDDVLQWWTQNQELRVLQDITQVNVSTPQGQQAVLDELKIRIWDNRHLLSLPFNEHSTGFQWFFSFLAAFFQYESSAIPLIILLDEPALGLHAKAQADFLRFIEKRLAKKRQVIYTTHSPFMIQPGHLERVRMVEDRSREDGARITKEVLTTDPDTLFPLQGALGYDLVQHLFIAPENLVVEGTSDFTYLTVISDFLKDKGRSHLDSRLSIVPVGGADAVPSFVALLGHHLNVTVLVDSRKEGHQRLAHLAAQGYLDKKRLIFVGEVMGKKLADVEDFFTPADYLSLYNRAFGAIIKPADLQGTDPIVSQIARRLGVERFDHGRPADVLLRKRDEILPKLSAATLDSFEKLFQRINKTLPA